MPVININDINYDKCEIDRVLELGNSVEESINCINRSGAKLPLRLNINNYLMKNDVVNYALFIGYKLVGFEEVPVTYEY